MLAIGGNELFLFCYFCKKKILKTKYLIVLSAVLLVIIGVLYYLQGGLNTVEIKVTNEPVRYLIGKKYNGNINSNSFHNMFLDIKQMKKNNELDGSLATIYFNNPENTKGEINAFFGVLQHQKPTDIKGFEIFKINSYTFVEGKLIASAAFMSKIYQSVFKFAEQNNLLLDETYLEWFPSDKEIVVQVKVN